MRILLDAGSENEFSGILALKERLRQYLQKPILTECKVILDSKVNLSASVPI